MLIVLIVDAENVEIVLKSKDCLNKPYTFYKMIRDALSVDGLFTLTGKPFVDFSGPNMFGDITDFWRKM